MAQKNIMLLVSITEHRIILVVILCKYIQRVIPPSAVAALEVL